MPPIQFGSATYKNLQINNKISTHDLHVNDNIYIQSANKKYVGLIDYILEQKESSYGIPGVMKGETLGSRKQIVTPNDLSSDNSHLYKHTLNNCHLVEVNLFDKNDNRVSFDKLSIVTLSDLNLQTTKEYLNYNSLSFSQQYIHSNNRCQYIDIEGDLSSVVSGHLLWIYNHDFIDRVILGYDLVNTINFFSRDETILVINKTFQFNIREKGFLPSINQVKGDTFFIKSSPNNVDVRFVGNPQKNGNVKITPHVTHFGTEKPLVVTMSIQDSDGVDYGCDFDIKFYVIEDALVTISENQEPQLIGNSEFDQYAIYNSSNSVLYIHEFDISTDIRIEDETIEIDPKSSAVLTTGEFNLGYSYTEPAPETFNSTIPLKSLSSSNTDIIDFTFLPYTYKPGLSNIHYQSFLNSPMEYFHVDYAVLYDFNFGTNQTIYSTQNQITYTHKNPVAHISYKPVDSAETSWVRFYRNGFYDNTIERNSLLFLPFDYQSFEIVIVAGNQTTIQRYPFVVELHGKEPSLLFLDSQENIQLTGNNSVTVSEILFEHPDNVPLEYHSMNSFLMKFISFQRVSDDFMENVASNVTVDPSHITIVPETFQLTQVNESEEYFKVYHYIIFDVCNVRTS